MTSKSVALLLVDLGITKSLSRPHVSNDNPYSETQFKTMKYRPDYPGRFGSLPDARVWARAFFDWYNYEHHHSAVGLMTPADVHYGRAPAIIQQRQQVLQAAYDKYPERFVKGLPEPPQLPEAVWINPPKKLAGEKHVIIVATVVDTVDPVDNSQRSGELSTSTQRYDDEMLVPVLLDIEIRA
jgi:putative transposase